MHSLCRETIRHPKLICWVDFLSLDACSDTCDSCFQDTQNCRLTKRWWTHTVKVAETGLTFISHDAAEAWWDIYHVSKRLRSANFHRPLLSLAVLFLWLCFPLWCNDMISGLLHSINIQKKMETLFTSSGFWNKGEKKLWVHSNKAVLKSSLRESNSWKYYGTYWSSFYCMFSSPCSRTLKPCQLAI